MRYFFALVFLLISKYSFEQNSNNTILQKGFYKNYNEFITNNPSVKDEFTTSYYTKTKTDPTIISAEYKLIDTIKEINHIWGFCDGNDVFVRYPHTFLNNSLFWKLELRGKFSFFTYAYKSGVGVGSPLVSAISAVVTTSIAPKTFACFIIDQYGRFTDPDIHTLKKQLKPYPELFNSFNKKTIELGFPEFPDSQDFESDAKYQQRMDLIKEYLIKLNEIIKN